MTKAMTKEIIRKMVRDEYETLCTDTEIFGYSDDITRRQCARWRTLDKLWISLYPDEDYLK